MLHREQPLLKKDIKQGDRGSDNEERGLQKQASFGEDFGKDGAEPLGGG